MSIHSKVVQARDLRPGDQCVGPAVFTEIGTVKRTLVNPECVQVYWMGGTYTVRPDTYGFRVAIPRRPRA